MSLPYFYEPIIHQPHHTLSAESAKHCIQVLRMKEKDELQLTDGNGKLFTADILKADKKNCEVEITNVEIQKPPIHKISIAISLLKNVSRLEWFLEKATEIGVQKIIPMICDHTEKQNFRFERMNSIIISAMLQSQQVWLPELLQPKKFSDLIKEDFEGMKLIAHCANDEKHSIKDIVDQIQPIIIFIGPEGDFSSDEISLSLKHNCKPVTLGNTRLRSETAGIISATLLAMI